MTAGTGHRQRRVVVALRLGVNLDWGVGREGGRIVDVGRRGRWVVDCVRVGDSGSGGESKGRGDTAGEGRGATLGAD